MSWKTPLIVVVLAAATSSAACAADGGRLWSWRLCWPNCIQKTCCDDYCPKPLPCTPRIGCFGCDDYLCKCAPCVPRIGCFGCDDYCPKCAPVWRCAPATHLKCVPTEPHGGPCTCGCGQTNAGGR